MENPASRLLGNPGRKLGAYEEYPPDSSGSPCDGAACLPLSLALSAWGTVRYVDANSAYATPPYTNWAIAARVI